MSVLSSIPVSSRWLLAAALLVPASGCRLCCDLEDAAYPAFGGSWTRTSRDSGRVGSLADPGGALSPQNLTPKRVVDEQRAEERFRNAPPAEDRGGDGNDQLMPEPKRDSETEEEFQERKRRFEAEMLNAGVILGRPAPPKF
ncbi:MAG: hypothetical protein AAF802_25150 [Planctomycetota bacterium]